MRQTRNLISSEASVQITLASSISILAFCVFLKYHSPLAQACVLLFCPNKLLLLRECGIIISNVMDALRNLPFDRKS